MLASITTLKHLSSACGGLSFSDFRLCWQTLFATIVILSLYAWCSRLPCYYTMSFGGSPKCLTRTSTERYLRDLEQLMCPPNTSFKDYLATLKSIGQDQCTFVWAKGAVAYRCRTCQILESRLALLPVLSYFPLKSLLCWFLCLFRRKLIYYCSLLSLGFSG